MEFGFLLHDIGKVAVPDSILYKPGSLTTEERALMARHPAVGAEIVAGIEFLDEAAKVVRSHHERWDGSGYPDGLAGDEIPRRGARIRRGRRARRAHHRSSLPPGLPIAPGARDDRGGVRHSFRPEVVEAFRTIDDPRSTDRQDV